MDAFQQALKLARPSDARVVGVREETGFRWLRLKQLRYVDAEAASACGRPPGRRARARSTASASSRNCAARGTRSPRAVRQFRPPLDPACIEVPAGLVDAGESAGAAALRELKEETGYVGELAGETAISYADPGVCNANSCFVYVEVDGDAPRNLRPEPELEESEAITTFSLPFDGLASQLERLIKAEPRLAVDARLYSFAVGLEYEQRRHRALLRSTRVAALCGFGLAACLSLLIRRKP